MVRKTRERKHFKQMRNNYSHWRSEEPPLRMLMEAAEQTRVRLQISKSLSSISSGRYCWTTSTHSRSHKCFASPNSPTISTCMMDEICTQRFSTERNGVWLATSMRSLRVFQNSLRIRSKQKTRHSRRRRSKTQRTCYRKLSLKTILS